MESKEYYIQQFKYKEFKCVPNNRRKNAQYLVIIVSNFKPIGVIICINENLLFENSKYKWEKPMLRCGTDIDDILLNFDYKNCKLI
jgi:hypothetical protein